MRTLHDTLHLHQAERRSLAGRKALTCELSHDGTLREATRPGLTNRTEQGLLPSIGGKRDAIGGQPKAVGDFPDPFAFVAFVCHGFCGALCHQVPYR